MDKEEVVHTYSGILTTQPLKKKKPFTGGFPGSVVVKNLPANAGNKGSSPGPGRCHMLWSN